MSGYDDFNRQLRRAARPRPFEHRQPPASLQAGDIGVGRGGAAGPPLRPPGNDINAGIRAAARIARHAQIRGGISLADLGPRDLWNR
jgi:hypothetical protein